MKPQLLRDIKPTDGGDEQADRPLTVADVDAIAEATARRVVEIVTPPRGHDVRARRRP